MISFLIDLDLSSIRDTSTRQICWVGDQRSEICLRPLRPLSTPANSLRTSFRKSQKDLQVMNRLDWRLVGVLVSPAFRLMLRESNVPYGIEKVEMSKGPR